MKLNKENRERCGKIIKLNPRDFQLQIAMEELAELIQAISKYLRYGDIEPLLEEYADVEVVCIGSEGALVKLGDVAEGLILRRSYNICLAVTSCLFLSLGCPLTGNNKVCLAVFGHKVEGHHSKLG